MYVQYWSSFLPKTGFQESLNLLDLKNGFHKDGKEQKYIMSSLISVEEQEEVQNISRVKVPLVRYQHSYCAGEHGYLPQTNLFQWCTNQLEWAYQTEYSSNESQNYLCFTYCMHSCNYHCNKLPLQVKCWTVVWGSFLGFDHHSFALYPPVMAFKAGITILFHEIGV